MIWFVKVMLCEYEYKEIAKQYYPNDYKIYSLFPLTPFQWPSVTEKEIRDARDRLTRKIAVLGGALAAALFALGFTTQIMDLFL